MIMIEEIKYKLEHFNELSDEEQEELKTIAKMMGIEVDKPSPRKQEENTSHAWWYVPYDETAAEKAETAFVNRLPDRPNRGV